MSAPEEFKLRHKAAQFTESVTRIFSNRLQADLGIDEATALAIAREGAHEVCAENGGSQVYIPRDLPFDLLDKHWAIYREFNGRNMAEVTARHKVTPQWVYTICARIRKLELEARQGRLPGLE